MKATSPTAQMSNASIEGNSMPDLLDKLDVLSAKSRQLRALLLHVHGSNGAAFRQLSAEIQDDYLWACSELATEIYQACRQQTSSPLVN